MPDVSSNTTSSEGCSNTCEDAQEKEEEEEEEEEELCTWSIRRKCNLDEKGLTELVRCSHNTVLCYCLLPFSAFLIVFFSNSAPLCWPVFGHPQDKFPYFGTSNISPAKHAEAEVGLPPHRPVPPLLLHNSFCCWPQASERSSFSLKKECIAYNDGLYFAYRFHYQLWPASSKWLQHILSFSFQKHFSDVAVFSLKTAGPQEEKVQTYKVSVPSLKHKLAWTHMNHHKRQCKNKFVQWIYFLDWPMTSPGNNSLYEKCAFSKHDLRRKQSHTSTWCRTMQCTKACTVR